MTDPQPFEITDLPSARVASDGKTTLMLTEPDGVLFRRRAVVGVGGDAQRREWAVARVGDVSVYVSAEGVIVSRKDLMP